jgi:hypothetical protein
MEMTVYDFFDKVYRGDLGEIDMYNYISKTTDNYNVQKLKVLKKDIEYCLFCEREEIEAEITPDNIADALKELQKKYNEIPDYIYKTISIPLEKDKNGKLITEQKKIINTEKLLYPYEFFSIYRLIGLIDKLIELYDIPTNNETTEQNAGKTSTAETTPVTEPPNALKKPFSTQKNIILKDMAFFTEKIEKEKKIENIYLELEMIFPFFIAECGYDEYQEYNDKSITVLYTEYLSRFISEMKQHILKQVSEYTPIKLISFIQSQRMYFDQHLPEKRKQQLYHSHFLVNLADGDESKLEKIYKLIEHEKDELIEAYEKYSEAYFLLHDEMEKIFNTLEQNACKDSASVTVIDYNDSNENNETTQKLIDKVFASKGKPKKEIENVKPVSELKELFEYPEKYPKVMELFVGKYIDKDTHHYIRTRAGHKREIVHLILLLHLKGYYEKQRRPTNKEIQQIAQNTFGVTIKNDTIKHNNEFDPRLFSDIKILSAAYCL